MEKPTPGDIGDGVNADLLTLAALLAHIEKHEAQHVKEKAIALAMRAADAGGDKAGRMMRVVTVYLLRYGRAADAIRNHRGEHTQD